MKGPGRDVWAADIAMTPAAAHLRSEREFTSPYERAPITLTVFVSCYNEEPYIAGTIDTVCAAAKEANVGIEIIVIDDGSKDRSREVVKDYIARHPEENIILRANRINKGLAQNYIDGAFLGKGQYYRLICGDNAEPKESIVAVMRSIGKADIVIPYYISSKGKSLKRRLISRTYTWLVNLVSGYRLRYYNGLAVHLRHNVTRWHTNTHGFGFQAEILCLLLDQGFSYIEIPIITIEQRDRGSNAINIRNMFSVAHTLSEIAIRHLSNRIYPRRR